MASDNQEQDVLDHADPADETSTALDQIHLPNEILLIIIETLAVDRRLGKFGEADRVSAQETLAAICLVSKACLRLAQPSLYQDLRLMHDRLGELYLTISLPRHERIAMLLQHTRFVAIDTAAYYHHMWPMLRGESKAFKTVLRCMSNLTHLELGPVDGLEHISIAIKPSQVEVSLLDLHGPCLTHSAVILFALPLLVDLTKSETIALLDSCDRSDRIVYTPEGGYQTCTMTFAIRDSSWTLLGGTPRPHDADASQSSEFEKHIASVLQAFLRRDIIRVTFTGNLFDRDRELAEQFPIVDRSPSEPQASVQQITADSEA